MYVSEILKKNMKRYIRKKLFKFLEKKGYIIKTINKTSMLKEFLKTLHPIESQFPLIRIGSDGDGGYLIPDDLNDIKYCFSPGVDYTANFEKDLIARGIKCYLADASVTKAPITDELIEFDPLYLGSNIENNYISLDKWIDSKNVEGDLILQMDIEGSEFDVILNTDISTFERFRIIAIEFHKFDQIHDPQVLFFYHQYLNKLFTSHSIVHIHLNNYNGFRKLNDINLPKFIELTLHRNDRLDKSKIRKVNLDNLPHPLDSDNINSRDHLPFPKEWFC
jgi:hypothetical protein